MRAGSTPAASIASRCGSKRLGAVGFRDADIADKHRGTVDPSGKTGLTLQAGDHFRNGFSGDFRLPVAALPGPRENRSFSWHCRTPETAVEPKRAPLTPGCYLNYRIPNRLVAK